MTVRDPCFVIQSDSHSAELYRQFVQGITGSPFGAFTPGIQVATAGGGHGVVGFTDFKVKESGTPNMFVQVPGGIAFVRGSQNNHQGVYTIYNDADVQLTVPTADGTNPRKDLVILRVEDAAYSGANNAPSLVYVAGTPAGSPVDPSLAAYNNYLVLARVDVPASDTAISNAQITDLRTFAYMLGSVVRCTSTTRPTGSSLYDGLEIYETDTDRKLQYDGTNWVIMSEPRQAWTPTASWTIGNGTWVAGYQRHDGLCDIDGAFTFGSSSAIAGIASITLPAATISSPGAQFKCGFGDVSAGEFVTGVSAPVVAAGTSLALRIIGTAGTYATFASTSATVPFTWATGDSIHFSGTYRMNTRYL